MDFIVVGLIDPWGRHPCISGDLCVFGHVDFVLLMKLCETEIYLESKLFFVRLIVQLFFVSLVVYELTINV